MSEIIESEADQFSDPLTQAFQEDEHADFPFALLMSAFVVIVVLTNTVGVKLFSLGGIVLPVSILWFPVTFLITDVVSEVYGPRRAQQLVYAGFSASLALLASVMVGIRVPSASAYQLGEAYSAVFAPTWRLLFASMCAYLLAQSVDVRIFHWVKRRTGGKRLWLRNNVSTMTSQLVDTTTVVFIFLYKNEAVFSGGVGDLVSLVFTVYVVKAAIAAADTPFCYWGVCLLRKARARTAP